MRTANQGPTATAAPPNKEKIAAEREKVQSKLDLASALSFLGQGSYDKAAQHFLRIASIKSLENWSTTVSVCLVVYSISYSGSAAFQLVAPSDIAIYGTLCALASYPRSSIKSHILDNDNFGVYLEQEPYVRELVEAYMASKFKTVLEILERNSVSPFTSLQSSDTANRKCMYRRDTSLICT